MRTAMVGLVLSVTVCVGGNLFAAARVSVNDIYAYGVDDRVEVRWTTPVPTVSRVEYGTVGNLGKRASEDAECLRGTTNNRRSGIGYANNHRATLTGIRQWPVQLRIVGKSQTAQSFRSDIVTVKKPPLPKATLNPGKFMIHINRGQWKDPQPPITVGAPMPKGALASAEQVRLVYEGRPVVCQAAAVTRYLDDRTIKWLRVTFLAPKGARTIELEYGRPAVRPRTSLTEGRRPGTGERRLRDAVIRTGAAAVTVKADGSGTLRNGPNVIRLPRGVLVDDKGKTYVATGETMVEEEYGPAMRVLRINGHHAAKDGAKHFAFEERIYAYAGKPYVRLDYTFGNDLIDPAQAARGYKDPITMNAVRSLRLRFDGPGDAPITVGEGGERCALRPGERVFQREDFEWVQEPGATKGKRINGVVRIGSARVLVRDFWEQWPKSVVRERGAVAVGLLPNLPEDFYANRRDEHVLYYHIRDGLHTFRPGMTKTHTLYLDVSGSADAESLIGDMPVACCDPVWIENSGALRRLAVKSRDRFRDFDQKLAKGIAGYKRNRDRRREYGLMNFGDWFGERKHNWGNLEYDLHHGLFTQFARTADARFFRIAHGIARHQGDVDTRHWAADPRRVGQQWLHCMGHTGGYYPYGYLNMSIYAAGYSDNRGHIWNRGLMEHYLLGGDRRSWNSALRIGDWAAGPQTTNFRFGNAREPGWMLTIVMPTYFATEDPFYLNGARLMVRKVREKSRATGNRGFYYHRLPRGHCNCKKKHYGEAGFMLATLMSGLHMYYEATGDKTAADDVVKIATFIRKRIYLPDQGIFRYTSCPHTSAGSSWILSEGLGFAANYSNDPKLREMFLRAMMVAWTRLPSVGKSGGSALSFVAQGLHELSRACSGDFAAQRKAIIKTIHEGLLAARRAGGVQSKRWLPTNVPNPDFEQDVEGWWNRGFNVTRSTEVSHTGKASMRIEGSRGGANEYVFTCYSTGGRPTEIEWLVPGRKYRLTAWFRVDRLEKGTPPPSMRIQFRDPGGSRGAAGTNAYDMSKPRTWQKLTCDFTLPSWNLRNYIALNTRRAGATQTGGLFYLDDVSVVSLEKAAADPCEYIRLDGDAAAPAGRTRRKPDEFLGGGLTGAGTAVYAFTARRGGLYQVWAKVGAPKGEVGRLKVNNAVLAVPGGEEWKRLGAVNLKPGAHRAVLTISHAKAWIGRIVLTTDPTGS